MDETMDIFIDEYIEEIKEDKIKGSIYDSIKQALVKEINAHIQEIVLFKDLSIASQTILTRWEEYNKRRIQGGRGE